MALSMLATRALARPSLATASSQKQQRRRAAAVMRATENGAPEVPSTSTSEAEAPSTFFYGGASYTEAEWKKAVAEGTLSKSAAAGAAAAQAPAQTMGLGDLMAFAGPAPELINSRLAMLAFVAALGAELSTGQSVLTQLAEEPTGVVLAVITFSVATLIPLLNSAKREAFGPFSPEAEILNGRAAMIGFAALLLTEAVRGGAALF